MSYDVFISHAHDDKSIADAVCATLEQRGIRCWIAPRDIQPGADWGRSIIDGIRSVRAIVLVFSAAANASPNILREVERAVHQGIPVIPLRIEDVMPEGGLEYHLGTVHWLDAMTPPLQAHLTRLSEVLLVILDRERKGTATGVAAQASSGPSSVTDVPTSPEPVPAILERAPQPHIAEPPISPKPASPRMITPLHILAALVVIVAIAAGATLAYQKWFRTINPGVARTLTGHTSSVTEVAFTPDSRLVASASQDSTVKLWDVATGDVVRTLKYGDSYINTLAVSPDGRYLASGDLEAVIKVWNVATGEEAVKLYGRDHTRGINSLAFSPDGRRLASASSDETVKVWDVVDGDLHDTIVPNPSRSMVRSMEAVAYSPDGRWIASGTGSGEVFVWEATTTQQMYLFSAEGDVHSVTFSPDNRLLAAATYGETVDLWDMATGRKVRTLNGHASYVHSVAFSPNGRWLISGAHDNAVQVWEVSTGRLVSTLAGHKGIVLTVAFSADGRYFASGSDDDTVKLWSTYGGSKDF